MKKLLISILSSSILMRASEEALAQAPESFSEEFLQEVDSLPSKVEMGWRDIVMAHWNNMSAMSQYITLGLLFLVVGYVVFGLMKWGKGCTCGCNKKDNCGCK